MWITLNGRRGPSPGELFMTKNNRPHGRPAIRYPRSRFLLAIILAAFAPGPLDAAESAAAVAESSALPSCELYPLAVGTQWLFQSGPLIVREKVVKHETVQGELCARIDTIYDDHLVSYEHVTVRADGVYRVAVSGKPVQPPLRFIALPAAPDSKWNVDSTVAGQSIRGEFVSGEGSFAFRNPRGEPETPFKTYKVTGAKFTAGNTPVALTYEFAPHLGKVRQTARTGGQETTLELRDIQTPGPAPTRTAESRNGLLR
ncbi:MAG: hypothetical protein K1X57_22760 [Gemmataceae bacterium]|nr:hypothetical protein [Gemmataceae bacterium]